MWGHILDILCILQVYKLYTIVNNANVKDW
jgi:hypothetical protein